MHRPRGPRSDRDYSGRGPHHFIVTARSDVAELVRRDGLWWICYYDDECMTTERGPYLTRLGARLARAIWSP